ncbi:hypothetical protein [Brachybacterium sp. 107]|uniref:hypothetical protein n=1 Tax=Brachybacterium sp. 107 TaxID=3457736 RepID=UPI0040349604
MAKAPIFYPRTLQRSGLVFLVGGLVATVVLALLHGGISWSNFGLLYMVGGAAMIIIGRVLESRARGRDRDGDRVREQDR